MPARPRTFRATLEQGSPSLGWTTAHVPFDPATAWPKMIRLRVRGEINGFAFRTSLFPDPRGGFYLLINRTMQKESRAHLGDTAAFHLEPDLDPRAAELPDELCVLLDDEPGLRPWYDELTEYTRREIGKWITTVKTEASRIKRAEQMAERLLSTKEAELELPPLIAAALRSNSKARAAWDRMTPLQRRNQLFAVFYYQTPDARQRRIDKLITTLIESAAKTTPKTKPPA
ncbi:MAG: YdeI/OmpD-associated family protein [Acidobacteriaceae bacterium]